MSKKEIHVAITGESASAVKAVGDVERGYSSLDNASKHLEQQLSSLKEQQALITSFTAVKREVALAQSAFDQAQSKAQLLGRQMSAIVEPTRQQVAAFSKARAEVGATQAAYQSVQLRLQGVRDALADNNIQTSALTQKQIALKNGVSDLEKVLAQTKERIASVADASRKAADATDRAAASNQQYKGTLNQVAGLVAGAFAVDKLVDYAGSVNAVSDQYKNLEARIGLAVGRQTDLRSAVEGVGQVALTTYSNLDATVSLYSRLASSAKELNLTNADALTLTGTINKSIQVSGASAQASAEAVQQLVQALQSGVLRGDEFNSIMEQAPRLTKALADGLNVPIGALRGMAEQGELTSARVVKAFKGQADVINAEFEKLPLTTGRALENLSTKWTLFIGQLSGGAQSSSVVAQGINALAENLQTLADVATRAGAVLTAALAVQGVMALRTFAAEMLTTGKAADLMSLSLSRVPKVISIAVAVTGFEIGWQIGSMLEQNSALARKLGVGITSFFEQIINDLKFVKEAAAAVFTDDTVDAVFDRYIERNKEISRITSEMWQDAEKGSFKATEATHTATTAVGQLGTTGTAAGQALSLAGAQGALGVDKVSQAADSARAALTNMAAAINVPAPITAINDIALSIANAAQQGRDLEQQLATQLPAAIAQLSGADLVKFRADFVNAMEQAKQALRDAIDTKKPRAEIDALQGKIAQLERATKDGMLAIAQQAAKNLGIDVPAAFGKFSDGYKKTRDELSLILRQLPELKAAGVDTGMALTQAFANMINGAKSQQELDDIKHRITNLKKELGTAITNGLLDQAAEQAKKLKQALEDTTPGIQSVTEAFRSLGITTDAALQETAAKTRKAYEAIRDSGTASARELAQAYKKAAADAAATGDVTIKAWADGEERALRYRGVLTDVASAQENAGRSGRNMGGDIADGWRDAERGAKDYADAVNSGNGGGNGAQGGSDETEMGAYGPVKKRKSVTGENGATRKSYEVQYDSEMEAELAAAENNALWMSEASKQGLASLEGIWSATAQLKAAREKAKKSGLSYNAKTGEFTYASAIGGKREAPAKTDEDPPQKSGSNSTAPRSSGSSGSASPAPTYQTTINLPGRVPVNLGKFSSAQDQLAAEKLIRELSQAAQAASK